MSAQTEDLSVVLSKIIILALLFLLAIVLIIEYIIYEINWRKITILAKWALLIIACVFEVIIILPTKAFFKAVILLFKKHPQTKDAKKQNLHKIEY